MGVTSPNVIFRAGDKPRGGMSPMAEDVWELTRAACPAMPQQHFGHQPGKRDASPMHGFQKSWIPFTSRRRMSSELTNPLFKN